MKIATEITEFTEKTLRVLCGENFHPTAGERQALMMNSSENRDGGLRIRDWAVLIPNPQSLRSIRREAHNQPHKGRRRAAHNKQRQPDPAELIELQNPDGKVKRPCPQQRPDQENA